MKAKVIMALGIYYVLLLNCTKDVLTPSPDDSRSITLRWVKAYENESVEDLEKGLLWTLSFLGAPLPTGSFEKAIQYRDSLSFDLRLEFLGFDDPALDALEIILDRIKASDEYRHYGALDAARFAVLTLHSSWHYYRITGVPESIGGFRQIHSYPDSLVFPVVSSSIAANTRMIKFLVGPSLPEISFLAEETGDGFTFDRNPYPIHHFETLDVMPNGQLRFAIYDAGGHLIPAAPARETAAGKPSKCLWCHETNVQSLFGPTPDVTGFMSSHEFQQWVDSSNTLIRTFRSRMESDLDFSRLQDHTFSELLYITFMEPTLLRIANEWKMDTVAVKRITAGLPQHDHAEFIFLRNLFDRASIDNLSPVPPVPVPLDVREPNPEEPNYF